MNILIRKLKQSDFDSWSDLWEQYLNYYKTQLSEEIYTTTFSRLINPDMINQNAFVAEVDGRLVGWVHYVYHDFPTRHRDPLYVRLSKLRFVVLFTLRFHRSAFPGDDGYFDEPRDGDRARRQDL